MVENRDDVIFDEFSGYEKLITKFKASLSSFEDSKTEKFFFVTIIYGFLFKLSGGKSLTKDKVESVLGRDLYSGFCDVREKLKLDTSMYGFFDRCTLANELLAKKHFFLKFYERRDKYRYLTKKGAAGENKITRDLSSSVIEKFNGYELIKRRLRTKEKEDVYPIHTVHEQIGKENELVACYFTNELHLAYRSYVSRKYKGKDVINHRTVK